MVLRFIYGEAISALPMNGGAYNVLINTTSKPVASFAACLAVISYIATGVVSAATAASYLQVLILHPVFFFATIYLEHATTCHHMPPGIHLSTYFPFAGRYDVSKITPLLVSYCTQYPVYVLGSSWCHSGRKYTYFSKSFLLLLPRRSLLFRRDLILRASKLNHHN